MISVFGILSILFLLLGFPIAMAIGGASITYVYGSGMQPMIIMQKIFSGINSTALLAIPYFVYAGDLMNFGGIAKRLVKVANIFVGRLTGGLAIVAILVCMFFGAISGSGVATAAAIGAIMIPEMINYGYDKVFAGALIACASTIGIIIPPSVNYVLYATITNSSIADLYRAGIPAGIMVGLSLMIVAYYLSRKANYKSVYVPATRKENLSTIIDAIPALLGPVIIVGGVFGGIFTPTESAVVSVFYSLLVGIFIYKEMKIKEAIEIAKKSALTSSLIMSIIAFAALFAYVLTYERIPQLLAEGVLNITTNPFVLLLLINIIMFLAGTILESSAITVILVPLLWNIAQQIGIHVTHFGIIVCVNIAIGLVTPPFGVCLYTTSSIGKIPVESLSKRVLLFIAINIVVLFIITYFPNIVMFMVK